MTRNQQISPPVPRKFVPPSTNEAIEYKGVQYYIGEQIGKGAFGAVFDCRDEWGNELAAKVLLLRNRPYETVREEWIHELKNLQQLRHPQVTFIHQAFEYRDTFYLIVEKCAFTLKVLIEDPSTNGFLMGSSTSTIMDMFTRTCMQEMFLYLDRKTQWFQTRTLFGDSRSAI
ncbi:protein kinase [Candidatus Poribacteria bacterium]|nr:protein kinase [Candidatus Poribacteria bacterium]